MTENDPLQTFDDSSKTLYWTADPKRWAKNSAGFHPTQTLKRCVSTPQSRPIFKLCIAIKPVNRLRRRCFENGAGIALVFDANQTGEIAMTLKIEDIIVKMDHQQMVRRRGGAWGSIIRAAAPLSNTKQGEQLHSGTKEPSLSELNPGLAIFSL